VASTLESPTDAETATSTTKDEFVVRPWLYDKWPDSSCLAAQQAARGTLSEENDGSPEKQEIDHYESDNHAGGAPDQHVTNIVPDHALSRFRCGLDDLLAMPFRHWTLVFLNEMDVAPLGAC
jgi:hypothetical protein